MQVHQPASQPASQLDIMGWPPRKDKTKSGARLHKKVVNIDDVVINANK